MKKIMIINIENMKQKKKIKKKIKKGIIQEKKV